ncbi:MAG: hypothetical protein ACLU4N_01275 [Butyricimonas faecihominis]
MNWLDMKRSASVSCTAKMKKLMKSRPIRWKVMTIAIHSLPADYELMYNVP